MSRTKAGLIAAALVIAAVAVITFFAVVVLLPFRSDFEVRTHRWWTKPLTNAKLNGIVKFVRSQSEHDSVFITNDGLATVKQWPITISDDDVSAMASGRVWINLPTAFPNHRPSDSEVLARLRIQLDAAEWKGSSWKPGRDLLLLNEPPPENR